MTLEQQPLASFAPPPAGWQPPPPGPPPVWGPPPPVRRRWSSATVVAVAALSSVVAVAAAVAVTVAVMPSPAPVSGAALSPTPPVASVVPAPPPLTPEAAQAQTCDALRDDYQSVANAIDARNTFNVNDWSKPDLLAASNNLVASSTELADRLTASLVPSTPEDLRRAVTDYVAGLRSMAASERNHAPAAQLNGVGDFYNQVLDTPLKLCGLPR